MESVPPDDAHAARMVPRVARMGLLFSVMGWYQGFESLGRKGGFGGPASALLPEAERRACRQIFK